MSDTDFFQILGVERRYHLAPETLERNFHERSKLYHPDRHARADPGAIGERESRRGTTAWYVAKHSPFAVLIQETKFRDFQKELRERQDVRTIFLITDSDDNFGLMRRELGRRYHCVQLYKSYLENFRINTVDRHAAGHDEESE